MSSSLQVSSAFKLSWYSSGFAGCALLCSVLYDLQRGRLPYYVLPPGMASDAQENAADAEAEDSPLDGALAFPEGGALRLQEFKQQDAEGENHEAENTETTDGIPEKQEKYSPQPSTSETASACTPDDIRASKRPKVGDSASA